MGQSLVVNSESFESSIDSFSKDVVKISETLDKIKNLMKDIDGQNSTWESKVGVKLREKYQTVEDGFEGINEEFKKFEAFLRNVLQDYKTEVEKENKSINDNSSDLNINE